MGDKLGTVLKFAESTGEKKNVPNFANFGTDLYNGKGEKNMFEKAISITDIFTLKNILLYLLMINIIGFFMMWSDKRKAKKGKWRIPEQTLFVVTALGGGIGTIAGMYTFRHKTKKLKFTIGLPALVILEIILVIYLKFM